MIEKSIKRLQFKLSKDKCYVDKEDREALNTIIDYYNETESYNINNAKLFTKLWINEFLKLTVLHKFTAKSALKRIEEILSKDINEYYDVLIEEIKFKRFFSECYKLGIKDYYNQEHNKIMLISDDDIEENKKIASEYYEQLKEKLIGDYTFEELQKFLNSNINRMIIDYGNR